MKKIILYLVLAFLTVQCGDRDIDQGFLVFVTSSTHTGSLSDINGNGGQAGGDAICQTRANEQNLKGVFIAYLSTDTSRAINRLPEGKWIRLGDGLVVVESKAGLTNGSAIGVAIQIDETGAIAGGNNVWTGTENTGASDPNNCSNWTSAGGAQTGATGLANQRNNPQWINQTDVNCPNPQRLYCFQID